MPEFVSGGGIWVDVGKHNRLDSCDRLRGNNNAINQWQSDCNNLYGRYADQESNQFNHMGQRDGKWPDRQGRTLCERNNMFGMCSGYVYVQRDNCDILYAGGSRILCKRDRGHITNSVPGGDVWLDDRFDIICMFG